MTMEAGFVTLVGALCGGRCYPDTAPLGAVLPYVTYQQVGGAVINPIAGGLVDLWNARVQVNAWGTTRIATNALMRSIEDALRPQPFGGRPIGALIARYEPTQGIRGAQQDFSVWWNT